MSDYKLPLFSALAFFLVGLATLSAYGLNWDSPLHFLRGQAYLESLMTGRLEYSGLPQKPSPILIKPGEFISRYYFAAVETEAVTQKFPVSERPVPSGSTKKISFYQNNLWNGSYFSHDGPGHPPLIDILSALSDRIFYSYLGWLGDIEAYHLINILIGALGVFIVSAFTLDLTGSRLAALVAGLSLALFPLYFAETHFNLKDTNAAVFFAGSVWAFWRMIGSHKPAVSSRKSEKLWFGVFCLFTALALTTKWTIVFLPFSLLPWLVSIRKTKEFRAWFQPKRLVFYAFLFLISNLSFLISVWPYLRADPLGRLLSVVNFYQGFGTSALLLQPDGWAGPLGINFYPLVLLLSQTPEMILFLVGLALVLLFRRPGDLPRTLLLAWLVVPLVRIALPGSAFYGGVRQIAEVLPALAILAGLGADQIGQNFNLKVKSGSRFLNFHWYFCLLIFAFLLTPIVRLHPNQNAYFNFLAGGTAGATQKRLVDWTISYGNVYRQAVSWLNQNAEKNARLAHLDGSMFAISPLWLRPDITVSPGYFSGFDQEGEYIMALSNPLDPPVFAARFPRKFLNPVHQITVEGLPLVEIYKNASNYNKASQWSEESLVPPVPKLISGPQSDYLEIDLGKAREVTRVTLDQREGDCEANELIGFLSAEKPYSILNPKSVYVLQEKRTRPDGMQYWFPAEQANKILVFPQSHSSCFLGANIGVVDYLLRR